MTANDTRAFKVSFCPEQKELEKLEYWLSLEEQETGDGFYCNLHLLKESFAKGEMAVAILKGETVGFLTWQQNSDFGAYINIAEIRPDLQCQGFGRKLVKEVLSYFKRRGYYTVDLECAPASSESFWRRMGFNEFPENSRGWRFQNIGHKRLYRTLAKTLEPTIDICRDDKVFELWNDDAHLMQDSEPAWVWKLEFKVGTRELVKPIIHPAAPEWRARLGKRDKVFKDGAVKRLLPWENTTGSFVMITKI